MTPYSPLYFEIIERLTNCNRLSKLLLGFMNLFYLLQFSSHAKIIVVEVKVSWNCCTSYCLIVLYKINCICVYNKDRRSLSICLKSAESTICFKNVGVI